MNSNWLKILENRRSEVMVNNGFTLSYLLSIGFITSISNVPKPSDIADINNYVANLHKGQVLGLRMCNNIMHQLLGFCRH